MHLIILTSFRTGSHMVRSMLAADPSVIDLGCPGAMNGEDKTEGRPVESFEEPGKIVLVTFRDVHQPLLQGSKVIHLSRRDKWAQARSNAIALKYRSWYGAAPEGATYDQTYEELAEIVKSFEKAHQTFEIGMRLGKIEHVNIDYEDVTVETLSSAVAQLGMRIKVGPPTTVKSFPEEAK